MPSNEKPRLIPTGKCWCGCGKDVGLGKFFAAGHDKIAEAALMALKYDGSVAQLLHAHGFGSHHSVRHAAVTDPDCSWEKCADCNYSGAPASIANHRKKDHPDRHVLAQAIRALGGTWDPQRAIKTLGDHGHVWEDQRAAEKRVRQILRDLCADGLIVKIDPQRAVYELAQR
ncbi:hypothetical protein [Streptomyces sp. CA-251251]|uniref:hypothetical protein n=1 Tax=Streptomyces sp. CA-251251 TaxID=3240063 RepID=UPI003D92065E